MYLSPNSELFLLAIMLSYGLCCAALGATAAAVTNAKALDIPTNDPGQCHPE